MVTVTPDRTTTTPQDVAVSLGEAAYQIGIPKSNLTYWIKMGWLAVLEESPGRGKPAVVDLEVVRSIAALRAPRRQRKTRGVTQGRRSHRDPAAPLPPRPRRSAPTATRVRVFVTETGVTITVTGNVEVEYR